MNFRLLLVITLGGISQLCFSYEVQSDDFPWQSEIIRKPNKSILDYFYLLPATWLDCESIAKGLPTLQERKNIISVLDTKNGYIKFFKSAEIVMFKDRKNAIDFLAIQIGKCGEGSNCESINGLFRFDSIKKVWVEQNALLPVGSTFKEMYRINIDKGICPYWKLPQIGLKIEIKDEHTESIISVLEWNGKSFVRVK
jgi:hypothetical protein